MAGGPSTKLLDRLDSGRPYASVRLSCEDWGCMSSVTCPPLQIATPRKGNDRCKQADVKHIYSRSMQTQNYAFFASTVQVETWDRTTHPRQPQARDVCRAMCGCAIHAFVSVLVEETL
jgi:hypothetical protein